MVVKDKNKGRQMSKGNSRQMLIWKVCLPYLSSRLILGLEYFINKDELCTFGSVNLVSYIFWFKVKETVVVLRKYMGNAAQQNYITKRCNYFSSKKKGGREQHSLLEWVKFLIVLEKESSDYHDG